MTVLVLLLLVFCYTDEDYPGLGALSQNLSKAGKHRGGNKEGRQINLEDVENLLSKLELEIPIRQRT